MSSPCGHVDDEDLRVDQALGEGGREVVAAGLHQDQLEQVGLGLQVLYGFEVGGDVVADGGVRAGAGFDGLDALGWQDRFTQEEIGVLAGVDVVGDHGDGQLVAQSPAQGGDGGGLARADRSAQTDAQGATGAVGALGIDGAVGVPVGVLLVEILVEMHKNSRRAWSRGAGGQEAKSRTGQAACCCAVMSSSGAEAAGSAPVPSSWMRAAAAAAAAAIRSRSGARRARTAVAWNGSRLSSRTVAVVSPLMVSYAAACAASSGAVGRPGGQTQHHRLVRALRPGRGQAVQLGRRPGGASCPHHLPSEFAGGGPKGLHRSAGVGGLVQVQWIVAERQPRRRVPPRPGPRCAAVPGRSPEASPRP